MNPQYKYEDPKYNIKQRVVKNVSIVSVRNSRVSFRLRIFIIIEYQYQFEMLEYQFEVRLHH